MNSGEDGRTGSGIGPLIAMGAGLQACMLALVAIGDLRLHVPAFLAVYLTAFGLYIAALAFLRAQRRAAPGGLAAILFLSLLFRVTLIFSPPSLSDDIYRYLWEGRLVLNGANPFAQAPDDPSLAPYRDEYHGLINNRGISTIYPPVAQGIFAVSQTFSRHPTPMKALAALGEFLLVLLLWRVLVARGMNPGKVLLYAWNPLPLIEFSGSGHIDVYAMLFLLLSLHLLDRERGEWSALALGLSFLTKFFAVCLLPLFWLRQRRAPPLLAFALLSLIAYLPFLDAGTDLFRGGVEYSTRWRFNGSIFELMVWITGAVSPSKALIGLLFGGATWLAARRWREEPFRAALFLAGLFVILSPTVHPWYVTWPLPFLCLYPRASWLYLSGAVVLSYWVLRGYAVTGEWIESSWVRPLEYAPFYLLLLLEVGGFIRCEGGGDAAAQSSAD